MAVPMLGALTKFVKRVAPNVYISGLLDCDKAGEQFLRDGPPSETLVDVGCGDGEKTMVPRETLTYSGHVGMDMFFASRKKMFICLHKN
jgi:hypothetical protein